MQVLACGVENTDIPHCATHRCIRTRIVPKRPSFLPSLFREQTLSNIYCEACTAFRSSDRNSAPNDAPLILTRVFRRLAEDVLIDLVSAATALEIKAFAIHAVRKCARLATGAAHLDRGSATVRRSGRPDFVLSDTRPSATLSNANHTT